MNIPILIASGLTLLAFVAHAFIGDRELKLIEPENENIVKQEKWTMARSGWHWISLDLLLATIGLMLISFTEVLDNERQLLRILAVYFLRYGVVWLIGIAISRKFPSNYLKLGQWILLWIIGCLIFWGAGVHT